MYRIQISNTLGNKLVLLVITIINNKTKKVTDTTSIIYVINMAIINYYIVM